MATPVAYGSDSASDQFKVTYPDVDNPSKTYTQNYYVKSVVKTDEETGEEYSVSTLYRDPWGPGAHEEVGTLYSNTNVFQPTNDASDDQAAYFTSPAAKTLIRQQARDTIIRGKQDAGATFDEASSYANQAVDTNAADSQDLTQAEKKEKTKPAATYSISGVQKVQQGTLWGEKAFSSKSKTLIYPEDHSAEEFDFIKITPIEYVPALSTSTLSNASTNSVSEAGGHYNINLNDDDWFGFKSVKKRYLRVKQVGSTIFLPMTPQGLSEGNAVDWGEDSMNAIQAAAGRLAFDAIGTAGGGAPLQAAKDLLGGAGNAAKSFMNYPQIEGFIKAYFAGQAVNANILGRAGVVVNPNLEVLFNGPLLRSFQYSFRFTPRTPSEATTVRTIIKVLKKTMAPKRRDKIFLNVPAVYKLRYIFNGDTNKDHPFLNKIKPCALSSLNVTYAPDGNYMTYDNGSMTSYEVSMSFKELEPIYNDDVRNVDDPTTGF